MALSQIQCLDDNHINPRTNESKPEFLYSEDQRLALEALLGDGREAFVKYLEARGLRGFLSDLEQETLAGAVEPYDPNSDVFPEGADENEPPLSLHYWPELSDTTIPLMDIGWPDCDSYRGVTRTTVYTQPPLEGQTHVKEIVRKMIAQAQKVIAVVMDVFTDVDIFRDLLDASFKRRVSVYILLEHTMLPHFLSMCRRANMHAGHLKHLRVRFSEGTEFYTRSCTKVRGRMGHRFMFVDGDKALSGSYSFTWMSSRLDRNLITVITGQAVEAFDRLFRSLYMNSRFVNLRQVPLAPEPEPEPIAQPVSVPLPSAALARKLHNPKYALVTVGNHSPASTPSPGNNSPKDSQAPEEPENKKRRRRKSLEAQEAPPLHPGLVNLEKAALIAYLPTWPEPDPPSDVIGFINIRDSSKPTPVHLQRSEMFGTSQAIRFSSPFSNPKETLPEVAKPRQLNNETKVRTEHQQKQDKSKTEEAMLLHNGPADGAIKNKEPEEKMAASPLKSAPVKNSTEPLNTQHNLNSNAPDTRPPLLSRSKPPTPNTESPSDATQTASTNKQVSSPAANDGKETQTKACLNTKQSATTQNRNHTLESKYTHLSADSNPVGEKPSTHTQSQFAPDTQVSTSSTAITDVLPVSSTRKNNPIATVQPSDTTHFSPAPLPKQLVTSPYMTLLSSPPVPKPRTILLTSKDEDKKQEPQKVQQPNNPPLQPSANSPQRNFPDAENSTTVEQRDRGSVKETRQRETSAEMGVEEAVGSRTHTQTSPEAAPRSQSDALIASKPNAESMHIQKAISKEAEREALMSGDGDVNPKPQREPLHAQTMEIRANREIAKEVPDLIKENLTRSKTHLGKPDETQIASSCEANSPITSKWTTLDSLKAQTQHVEDSFKPSPAENNSNCNNSNGQVANAQMSNRPLGLTLSNAHAPELHSQKSLVCLKAQSGLDIGDGTMPSPAKKSTQGTFEEQEETNHITKTHLGSSLSNTQAPELCSQKTLGSSNAKMQGGTDIHDSSMPSPAKNITQGTTHDQIVSTQTPKRPIGLSLSDTQAPELLSQKTLNSLNAQMQGDTDVDVSSMTSPAKNNAQGACQGEEVSTLTPKTPIGSSPFNAYTPELRSPTPEKESLLLAALMRSPTPDGLRQCSSTPDFRTPTPDFRSLTPDFRSGTPLSDGYTSTREDSTSDEFYECSDSPVPEPVRGAATEGRVNSTSHSSALSSSSVVERVVRSEEVKQEESGKPGEEGGDPGILEGENPVENHVDAAEKMQIVEDSAAKTADKQKEAQTQRRKKVESKPAAETSADGGAIPAESTAQQTEPKQSSACDVRAEETGVSKRAAAPTVEEKSDRLQASRDTGAHMQQGIAAFQLSRQPQQSRPHRSFSTTQLAGSQSWGSSPLSQADPKARHGSTHVLDYTSRKAPPRPVPPHAAAHKQAAPHGQQAPLSRQPHAAQARVRGAPPQDQSSFPKPPTSFLQQRNPPPQNRAASAQEARRQDEGRVPFSFSFSRLYNLKGLKDKIGRIPAQSKRSSTSPQQNHHHHS